jgi:hypothetical protein
LFEGTKLHKKNELTKFFSKKIKKSQKSSLKNVLNRVCGKKNFAVPYILRIFAIAYWNNLFIKT